MKYKSVSTNATFSCGRGGWRLPFERARKESGMGGHAKAAGHYPSGGDASPRWNFRSGGAFFACFFDAWITDKKKRGFMLAFLCFCVIL